jgi:hypothetical protein
MGFTEGSESWTTSTRPLRNTDDRYGFRWMASPFEQDNIVSGIAGVFWSAGVGSNETNVPNIKRVVASVANGWASNPLTVDTLSNGNPAGTKGKDFLPVRCVLGQGAVANITSMEPLQIYAGDTPEEEPCLLGCLCEAGDINAGTIVGQGCSGLTSVGAIGTPVTCKSNIYNAGTIGCFQ